MLTRRPILLVVTLAFGLIIYIRADWLSERSDALQWQVLPWVLLVFFWAFLLRNVWRARSEAG